MPYFELKSGYRLYYEKYGSGGPPIVLLHGLASSSRLWLRQIRTLQKYYEVHVLDFPGHGRSDRQPRYSLSLLTEQLAEWMKGIELKRAHFMAISIGCSIALTFAARYPNRVNKLILEGPVGGYHRWWNPLGWPDWLVFTMFPISLRLSIAIFGAHAIAQWLNTFGVKAKRNMAVLEELQNQTDFKALTHLLWSSACTSYTDQLGHITAPTLLVRGKNDPMPRRFVLYINDHVKNSKLIEVPDTRHLVALENPALFNKLALDFLKSTPTRFKRRIHGHVI